MNFPIKLLIVISSLCIALLQAASVAKTKKNTKPKIYFVDLSKGEATQSTTAHGGKPSRAIDGNINGVWNKKSVTHTANKANQWWQVKIKHSYPVTSVVLYNRNVLQKRLTNFAIVLLDDSGAEVFRQSYYTDGTFFKKSQAFPISKEGIFAKVIRIEQLGKTGTLSLAEVKATTSQVPLLPYKTVTFNEVKKLDLSAAEASQSTTRYEAEAARVIDANTNASWAGKTVNHTEVAQQQWWQVKLAKQQVITSLTLYNRVEGQEPERLSNFAIILLNNKGREVFRKNYHENDSYVKGFESCIISAKGIAAQVIKIQQLGDEDRSLSIAEVELYGAPKRKR